MKFEVWSIGPRHARKYGMKSGYTMEIRNKGEKEVLFSVGLKKRWFRRLRINIIIHPKRAYIRDIEFEEDK